MDLRSLRSEKGYTLKQVAEGTGLPLASIGYWESGERQPAADVLPKLAEFYGITTDKLLGYKAPNLPEVEEPEEPEYEIKDEHGFVRRNVSLDELENAIKKDLSSVKKSFFKIGYKLTIIQKYALFINLGYQNLVDYAADKFGFGKTTTYDLINVYELTHSAIYPAEMDEQFLPYDRSKLVELSACCDKWRKEKLISVVSPTDSVKDIREYVKLWNKTCSNNNYKIPEGATVKEALAIAAEEQAKKALPQPSDDVPPGQMSIFDDEENERPFDEPSEEPQEETKDEFGGQEFVQGGGIDYDEENDLGIDIPPSKKPLFRLSVKEFCEQYNYTIELHGHKQGAWAFGSVLFDYLKEKGLFD